MQNTSLNNENEFNHNPNTKILVPAQNIYSAYKRVKKIVVRTPLQKSETLSDYYNANIYLKREDLQIVRSYKIRGAYNKIISMPEEDRQKTIYCASAGNHAQGVAYVCQALKTKCVIYMPTSTPSIKINAVRNWGKEFVQIVITGDTFDESFKKGQEKCQEEGGIFVPAFDDEKVIEGQGTIAVEILEDIPEDKIDFMFFPVGGGGCGSGIVSYFKQISPQTIMVGVEPEGSPSMFLALKQQRILKLDKINTFVDGAAIQQSGQRTYEILNSVLKTITLIPEGKVCTTMIKLFNKDGILVEPAGALAVSALDDFKDIIKGKTVVCLISGSNNDLSRMTDIKMLSNMHKGKQYYLLISFFLKPGSLKLFLSQCLGPNDEITTLEPTRKNNREKGPCLVGIMVKCRDDFDQIKNKMVDAKIQFRQLSCQEEIFKLLL